MGVPDRQRLHEPGPVDALLGARGTAGSGWFRSARRQQRPTPGTDADLRGARHPAADRPPTASIPRGSRVSATYSPYAGSSRQIDVADGRRRRERAVGQDHVIGDGHGKLDIGFACATARSRASAAVQLNSRVPCAAPVSGSMYSGIAAGDGPAPRSARRRTSASPMCAGLTQTLHDQPGGVEPGRTAPVPRAVILRCGEVVAGHHDHLPQPEPRPPQRPENRFLPDIFRSATAERPRRSRRNAGACRYQHRAARQRRDHCRRVHLSAAVSARARCRCGSAGSPMSSAIRASAHSDIAHNALKAGSSTTNG